jgi:hypothetical protein
MGVPSGAGLVAASANKAAGSCSIMVFCLLAVGSFAGSAAIPSGSEDSVGAGPGFAAGRFAGLSLVGLALLGTIFTGGFVGKSPEAAAVFLFGGDSACRGGAGRFTTRAFSSFSRFGECDTTSKPPATNAEAMATAAIQPSDIRR